MWQTQDERKLLVFMQLFQQWLQVAAALHLEELEEQRRRGKEDRRRREARRRTRRQRTQWVRQWLLRTAAYGQYEKFIQELTTKDQTSPAVLPSLPTLCSSALCPCILHTGSCKTTHGPCTSQPRLAPFQEWGTLHVTWPSWTAMPAVPMIQCRRLAWIPIRECLLRMPHGLPALWFFCVFWAHCSRHTERYNVFFWRTGFNRRRCRSRCRSSMLRTFRLGRPLWSCRRRGWSYVIWMNSKDEMMRSSDPYPRFVLPTPASVLSPPHPYCVLPTAYARSFVLYMYVGMYVCMHVCMYV